MSNAQNTENTGMDRVTLRVPKRQLEEIERAVDAGEYPNRSEAIRAAIRDKNYRVYPTAVQTVGGDDGV